MIKSIRKILISVSFALMAISLSFALAACGNNEPSNSGQHTHTLDHIEAKSETCTSDGNVEYWTCTVCKKNFSDSKGNVIITDPIIVAVGHNYVNGICSRCGDIKTTEGLRFELITNNGVTTYAVSGIGTSTDKNINIPTSYNDVPVIAISDNAFENCNTIETINIPESVEIIGASAFRNCYSLLSITITDNIRFIGSSAFDGCYSLQYDISNGIFYLGNWAIKASNTNITSIQLKETTIGIYEKAFANCTKLKEVELASTISLLGQGIFSGCANIEKITIPYIGDSLKTAKDVYQYPFGYIFGTENFEDSYSVIQKYHSDSLSSVDDVTYYIPSSLKYVQVMGGEILDGAFYGCTSLEKIILPTIKSIGTDAFYNCSGLTSLDLPDGIEVLPDKLFEGCSGLITITLPEGIKNIPNELFKGCSGLEEIVLPDSLESIPKGLLKDCGKLKQLTLPFVGERIKNSTDTNQYPLGYIFGENSFNGTLSVAQTYIGTDTESTISTTYYIPKSLEKVTIQSGKILFGAFSNLSSIKEIIIGNSVTSISRGAFSGIVGIESLSLPFVGNSKKTKSSVNQYPFGYIFSSENYDGSYLISQEYYSTKISNRFRTSTIRSYIPNSLKRVTITGGEILYGAFMECKNIMYIDVPEEIEEIGEKAFSDCYKLITFTVGSHITSIGNSAFSNCYWLVEICNKSSLNIKTHSGTANGWIGNHADYVYTPEKGSSRITITDDGLIFYSSGSWTGSLIGYCDNIASELVLPEKFNGQNYNINSQAFYNCEIITSIVMSDYTSTIGLQSFNGCVNLKSVVIGSGVTIINSGAFSGCTSLASVTFKGNKNWNVYTYSSGEKTSVATVTSDDVQNKATAATLLGTTYRNYYWETIR